MKKFELIVGFAAILGICLKILHFPGSTVLTVLAFGILSIFYYVFSFTLFNDIGDIRLRDIRLQDIFRKESHKDSNAKGIKEFVRILWSWTLPLILIGGLFKLQFWAGGNRLLLLGLLSIGLILLTVTIFKSDYYKRILKRIAIYGGLGLVLFLTPTATLVDIYYRNNPEYAELYKKVLAAPDNLELREQLEQMKAEMRHPGLSDEENK